MSKITWPKQASLTEYPTFFNHQSCYKNIITIINKSINTMCYFKRIILAMVISRAPFLLHSSHCTTSHLHSVIRAAWSPRQNRSVFIVYLYRLSRTVVNYSMSLEKKVLRNFAALLVVLGFCWLYQRISFSLLDRLRFKGLFGGVRGKLSIFECVVD